MTDAPTIEFNFYGGLETTNRAGRCGTVLFLLHILITLPLVIYKSIIIIITADCRTIEKKDFCWTFAASVFGTCAGLARDFCKTFAGLLQDS